MRLCIFIYILKCHFHSSLWQTFMNAEHLLEWTQMDSFVWNSFCKNSNRLTEMMARSIEIPWQCSEIIGFKHTKRVIVELSIEQHSLNSSVLFLRKLFSICSYIDGAHRLLVFDTMKTHPSILAFHLAVVRACKSTSNIFNLFCIRRLFAASTCFVFSLISKSPCSLALR